MMCIRESLGCIRVAAFVVTVFFLGTHAVDSRLLHKRL
jgi:hypothetical protein